MKETRYKKDHVLYDFIYMKLCNRKQISDLQGMREWDQGITTKGHRVSFGKGEGNIKLDRGNDCTILHVS